MNRFLKRARNMAAAGTALLLGMVASAHAVLTAEATAALTDIGTGVSDMEAGVWPYVGAATVAVIGIKLFKRFSNKI